MVTATREFFGLEGLSDTHRFTVAEYHQLRDIGVLDSHDALELLDGYIVHKGCGWSNPLRPLARPGWSPLRLFTVPEYHAMIDAGILKDGDPVELIDGVLVKKMSRNPPHDAGLDLFRVAIAPFIAAGTMLRSQQAVTLLDGEPEPDFAIVFGGPRTYARRHPRQADIKLIVEVSAATLHHDRTVKFTSYARNRLPVYWIVNVEDGQIEVYTDPDAAATPPVYGTRTDYLPGQDVPIILDGQHVGTIPAADLLP